MRVGIADLMDKQGVLFGTEMGRACLARMVAERRETQEPEALFLDFGDVAAATVSFLREGPLAYRRLLRERDANVYPVFANLAPPVMDSLGEYLRSTRDAVFACQFSAADGATQVRVLGQLETKQKLAFDAVHALGEVTAAQLAHERWGEDRVGATAWSNRLAALAGKGLVMVNRVGRRKSFRLTLEVAQWA